MYRTYRAWWTVEDAARLLRVHTDTLYDACRRHDFPHVRNGPYIRIPAQALRLEVIEPRQRPSVIKARQPVWEQLQLPLGPIVPLRKHWNESGRYGVGTYGRIT